MALASATDLAETPQLAALERGDIAFLPRAGFEVAPVGIEVDAVLLDDEHGAAQREDPVQRARVELVDRRVVQGGHGRSACHRSRPSC